uniref:Uncharacterized protein n=1 Tax=Aegilops tauschii subsp. strangulata TaxID=200361 RepID=A0A452Y1I5_AEGTS
MLLDRCDPLFCRYCSDPVVLDATLVEWSCDECQAKQGNAAADKLSAEALNRKRPSHYLTEITVATNSVSKKACVQKGDQEEHFA